MTRRLDRRRALVGAVAGAAALAVGLGAKAARQESPTLIQTGDCSLEPGVQLLLDWRSGLPVMRREEMLPPLSWVAYSHPSLPLFLSIPPDWTPYAGWATMISRTGVPLWEERPPSVPQLTLFRLVSPRQDAAYEYAVGSIQGQPLLPPQVAVVAQQGLLGEAPRLTPVCHFDDSSPLAPSWAYADRFDQSVLVSSGTALGLPDVFLPATTVTYQNLYGPRADYEGLMRTVFIPILFQFLGGGSEPTPTPTPEF